jgi:hypothetical protein
MRPEGSSRKIARRVLGGTPDVDGRTHLAKKARAMIREIIEDNGGLGQLSETKLQLIKRFAASAVLAEALELNVYNGHAIDVGDLAALSSTMVRISARIGVRRRPSGIVVEQATNVKAPTTNVIGPSTKGGGP